MLRVLVDLVFADAFRRMAEESGNIITVRAGGSGAQCGDDVQFMSNKTGNILAKGQVITIRKDWAVLEVHEILD